MIHFVNAETLKLLLGNTNIYRRERGIGWTVIQPCFTTSVVETKEQQFLHALNRLILKYN